MPDESYLLLDVLREGTIPFYIPLHRYLGGTEYSRFDLEQAENKKRDPLPYDSESLAD